MDIMFFLPVLSVLLVIGAIAGLLAGLLGVGGGMVLVPAFFYAFRALGYDGPALMHVCLATSLATIIVTSIRSTHAHHRKGAVDWILLKSVTPGILFGAILGVLVAAKLPSLFLQIVFSAFGILLGGYMILGKSDRTLRDELPSTPIFSAWSGGMSFLSVLLGIGGGSMAVPFMTLHNVQIHRAVATAAGFGLAISLPSAIAWFFVTIEGPVPPFTVGAVNLAAFATIVPMTMITAPIGARLAHSLPAAPLKKLFGAFLVVVAFNMLRAVIWG